jgi:hypothetical protein
MRRDRLAFVLAIGNAALLVALLVQGRGASAAAPDTVRARAIELVDERGRVRAQMNVEPDGQAVLRLRDATGEVRVKIGADAEGSGLLLLDGATEPGVHMLAKRGGSTITLTGKDGQRRKVER